MLMFSWKNGFLVHQQMQQDTTEQRKSTAAALICTYFSDFHERVPAALAV